MPASAFSPTDFLTAETILDHLLQNLSTDFELRGSKFDRDTMQKHVNSRAALIMAKGLLLDEVERLIHVK